MAPEAKDARSLLSEWNEARLRKNTDENFTLDGEVIVGPRDLAIREILVDKYLRPNVPDLDKLARPTTVFLWELGEGPAGYMRRGTRIGGTPWWPADRPWPYGSDGVPLRFAAQIDFGIKHSLAVELPGDLLTIFFSEEEGFWGDFTFIWHTADSGTELLQPTQVPPTNVDSEYILGPFFGHPYLAHDYELHNRGIFEKVMPEDSQAALVAIMQATKIGGIPYFIQGGPSDEWEPSWTFICTLSSVWNKFGYMDTPEGLFLNQPDPLPEVEEFMFGDVGQIYICLDKSGVIKYWSDCY